MSEESIPNLQALGRLIEQRRLAAGLRPGELALRAKLRGESPVGGNDVRDIELRGKGDITTVVRLLEALSIDDATVLAACGLDLADLRRRWDEWAAVPEPVVLSVRLVPAVWCQEAPPQGMDREATLAWATGHPKWSQCLRCIRWSRRHCTYIRPDGTSYEVRAVFPENCPEPWMALR